MQCQIRNITPDHPDYAAEFNTEASNLLDALQQASNQWWGGIRVATWQHGAKEGAGRQITLLSGSQHANGIGRVFVI